MDLNVNASPITQVATTTAVGGPGVLGSGGDAIAVTNQDADSTNIQMSDHDYFPWGGPAYDFGPDLNVNASPITQVATTTALGGLGFSAKAATPLPSPTRTPTSSTSRAKTRLPTSAIGSQPVALFLFGIAASHSIPVD